jgi:NAD(P)-dependent dehydrogenase (short-subunit alcohol dehydrogenase family)
LKPPLLDDKVILITGASSGIGAAAALAFDAAGAWVAMASRRKDKLEDLASRMNHPLVITADLSNEAEAREMIARVIAHYGRIDVLVNNAASIIVARSETVTSDDLLLAFRTNVIAAISATQEAIRFMHEQGTGHIINIGSPGFMMGIPFYAPYVCSKAALTAWTRTIQAEWAGSGITVSEYFPGYIKTDSLPESRLGRVEQDFLMTSHQNFISRIFTKPKTPEHVAGQLVKLIIKPRVLVYSDIGVKIGAYISNMSGFRLAIARQMAETARKKKHLVIFTES